MSSGANKVGLVRQYETERRLVWLGGFMRGDNSWMHPMVINGYSTQGMPAESGVTWSQIRDSLTNWAVVTALW